MGVTEMITQKLKIEAMKKRVELEEAKLTLLKHQVNEEIEKELDKEHSHNSQNGMFFTNEQLHKLLSYLEHSFIPKGENLCDTDRTKLINLNGDFQWDIAEHLGYDLNEGRIRPHDYKFVKFISNK
jgi:hypothetical protein